MTTEHPELSRRGFLTSSAGGVGAALLLAACGKASTNAGSSSTTSATATGGATGGTDTGSGRGAGSATASSGGKKLTSVAFDYPFTFLPVYAAVTKFAKQHAGDVGVDLKLTSDNAKLETQVANLTTLINQKTPAIVSFPLETASLEKQAKAARAAGTIWVTYGGNLQNQDASITFSFLKGGQLLGEVAAAWAQHNLGGKGTVAFLVDNVIELGRLRTQGMVEAFTKAAPNMRVVAKQQAISPDQALTATNAILSSHPDVNVILAVTDDAGTGAYQALTQRGRAASDPKTFLGGQDGGKGALQLIQKGTFYRASAALAVKDIGYAVIDVPKAVAAGSAHPSKDVPITLVQKGSPKLASLLAQYS